MYSTIHNLSLKGITGVLFGIISILYIYLVEIALDFFTSGTGIGLIPISYFEILLVVSTFTYILISFFTIILINQKRRKKFHLKGWNTKAEKIFVTYIFSALIGGITSYYLLNIGQLKLIIPISLLLYGITYLIIKKYTNLNSPLFGFLFMFLGVLAYIFPNQAFLLWSISFGGFHILYGIFDKKLRHRS